MSASWAASMQASFLAALARPTWWAIALAGGLSGLILEDAGRLQIRLGHVVAPDDPERPWRCPAIVRAAFRFEPARAATMRPNELADTVLAAFRRAVEGLSRP